jgi:hypothetical protein
MNLSLSVRAFIIISGTLFNLQSIVFAQLAAPDVKCMLSASIDVPASQ